MDAARFAEGYNVTLEPHVIHYGDPPDDIKDAQRRSYQFGRLLHAKLRGALSDTFTQQSEFDEYKQWAHSTFPAILHRTQGDSLESLLTVRHELDFHVLNRYLLPLWGPIVNGDWPERQRGAIITAAADKIALEGLEHLRRRDQFIQEHGAHALYDEKHREPRIKRLLAVHTGIAQDYDTTIIFLELLRNHRNLTFVPAPLQFGRDQQRDRNANFIFVDFVDHKAVGVSVATRLNEARIKHADTDRLVFVDNTMDIGNVRAVRTKKQSSNMRSVPWPGLVAANRVKKIRANGRHSTFDHDADTLRRLMELKVMAQRLAGKNTLNYQAVAQTIGQRIMHKLYMN